MNDKEFKKKFKAFKKKIDSFEEKNPMMTAFNLANELLDKPRKKAKKKNGI